MLEELIGQCSEGSAVGLFVGAVHKKMAGASITARHQQVSFSNSALITITFFLSSFVWHLASLDDGNWYHFGSLLICLLVAVCTYWFATKTVIMAVLLWRRRLFVWRMMAIMRACPKSTGASGSARRRIRQRMALRTSRNRCDLKIWIRKEHHQRSYLVHLNLCSHLFYVLRPRALLHISQLHMLSDILLHNILHEHTDGV